MVMKLRCNQMVRNISVLFGVLLGLGFFGNVSASAGGGSLVSPSLLRAAGLEKRWQIDLPVKWDEKDRYSESVERMFVFDEYLYVLTSDNYLFCIDRLRGAVRFEMQLAIKGLKICDPYYYGRKLWFMVGNELLVLDPLSGKIVKSKQFKALGRSAVCTLSRNDLHIYIAGADRRLHAVDIADYLVDFKVTADNDSLITSVAADNDLAAFSTEAGNVVSISAGGPKKQWQVDITGKITAPIVKDGNWLYVSGQDAKVYKLSFLSGAKGWAVPFQAEIGLVDSVTAGQFTVYQYAGEKGLYAIDKVSGEMVWNVEGGLGLLAEKEAKAFVLARPGVLVVMDNELGKKLYSVNFAGVSRYAVNTTDAVMYVADAAGRVASID